MQILQRFWLLTCVVIIHTGLLAQMPQGQYYQLTIYHYATPSQQEVLEDYLQHALLPALRQHGIGPVGVFAAMANDTAADKRILVLIPMEQLQDMGTLMQQVERDPGYRQAGKTYLDATYNAPPYNRMEHILLRAFRDAPRLQVPSLKAPHQERVYELRSYESATEKIFANKVHMFNEGDEVGLFKRLNFNAAFYGEVVAGSHMPNLMYMTCFNNMADRDAHWKTFVDDPQWKQLSTMPLYQKNVSHIDIDFLRPMPYSQL